LAATQRGLYIQPPDYVSSIFSYLLAELEIDFRGRGLAALPPADRFPVQLSCDLLSVSDEDELEDELTAPCSDIITNSI